MASRPGWWCGRSRPSPRTLRSRWRRGTGSSCTAPVTTEAWTDKQTGEKRTAQRVLAEIVGPSLRWATARITKTTRTSAANEDPHDSGENDA
jgi:hypothetical protein